MLFRAKHFASLLIHIWSLLDYNFLTELYNYTHRWIIIQSFPITLQTTGEIYWRYKGQTHLSVTICLISCRYSVMNIYFPKWRYKVLSKSSSTLHMVWDIRCRLEAEVWKDPRQAGREQFSPALPGWGGSSGRCSHRTSPAEICRWAGRGWGGWGTGQAGWARTRARQVCGISESESAGSAYGWRISCTDRR